MSLRTFFLLYFGNWQVIAMMTCLYYLMLKTFNNIFYHSVWKGFKFDMKWIPVSIFTVSMIFLREFLLYPLTSVQSWMPNSFLWEQVIMWLYTTHTISILTYTFFIYYSWKKFDSFIPALLWGFFSIGFIEFTFIPQHLIKWQMFLGVNWYYAFGIAMLPFIVEYKRFHVKNWKKMLFILILAFINQYGVLALVDYSISVFDFELLAYRLNYALMPHPPVYTWMFMFLQTSMKILFLLGLSQIVLKEIPEDANS